MRTMTELQTARPLNDIQPVRTMSDLQPPSDIVEMMARPMPDMQTTRSIAEQQTSRSLAELQAPRPISDMHSIPMQHSHHTGHHHNHVQEAQPPAPRLEQDRKSGQNSPLPTDPSVQAILAYLRKQNLGETEQKLIDEIKKREAASAVATPASDPEVGNVLSAYRSDGDPSSYASAYR